MTEEATVTPPPQLTVEAPEQRSFASTVLGIAGMVTHRRYGGAMDRGSRAELRRMRSGDLFPPEPFWMLVARYDIRPSEELFWIDVVPLMVDHRHNQGLPPGRALAEAGVSGARIERWLRFHAERAREEAGRLLTRLDSGLNWVSFASLLRFWNDDRNRRALARDFFLSDAYRARARAVARQEAP
jgi:CRISPR type I-E-associated protein CasB/Cse2